MATEIVSQLPLFSNEPETIIIPLTQGQSTVISVIDADLADYKWHARPHHSDGYYAVRNSAYPNRITIRLHRVILERIIGRPLTKTECVDHVSGDKRDNRRENLRLATDAQNKYNRGKTRHNTSGYKGVYWNRASGKWAAQIAANGKKKHLGYFDNTEEAYAAYCKAAQELHGEFFNPG